MLNPAWYALPQNQPFDTLFPKTPPSPQRPIAVICPHAGIAYSGAVTAATLHHCRNHTYDRIFIIGPSHFVPLHNQITAPQNADIRLDHDVINTLPILHNPALHAKEHSAQIMFPFLRHIGLNVPVIPLIIGTYDNLDTLAVLLKPHITPNTLLLISSDFTHYGNAFGYVPFTQNIPENIQALDTEALHYITTHDLTGFETFLQKTHATICGQVPIRLLLKLIPKESNMTLEKYETSGHLTGDWTHSVSYVGVSIR